MNNQTGASSTGRSNRPVFGTYSGNQASIFLEKSNPGLRRSTPDSEALASSDEELEPTRLRHAANSKQNLKAGRRTFSLADSTTLNRKPSITASGTYSPSASNPGTPSAEQNPWPAMSPGSAAWAGNNAGYPWGSIWTQESRKDPPARLQEVHPHEDGSGLPFTIPLQPTPKTYRSQSYSVGQLDSGIGTIPSATSGAPEQGRMPAQYPSLQRRTSRGLMASGGLGRVGEMDDDDNDTLDATTKNVDQAREIERLEMENAQLRAAQNRDRTMSSGAASQMSSNFRSTRIRGPVPEESDHAVDDDDASGLGQYQHRNTLNRRFSEQVASYSDRQQLAAGDSRNAKWQTSLGFGRLAEIPQSRRHSFAADVPTRHGSFSSHGETQHFMSPHGVANDPEGGEDMHSYDTEHLTFPHMDDPVYFKLDEKRRLDAEASVQQGMFSNNPYGPSANLGAFNGPSQTFVIVNFKCCRSDIFYIQEGTGLQVQVGELVIVDADRGTDLGAVVHVNVTLEESRRFKEYYAEEHYKLLMMFSQQTKNGGMNAVNPNGPGGRQSAVGGMGPQGHGHRDAHGDPKAKMIKRVAQKHEVQALQEKEGNEAKAKRVCSSKVIEHGLNMEILDAEFQMDGKKLTFYYFADEYINFNSLVTDLFKIYKTRIWMSAINPASFQTPTSSLGLTPAYGNPGFMSPLHEANRRHPYPTGNTMTTQYSDPRDDLRARAGMAPSFFPQYQSPPPPVNQRMAPGMGGYPSGVHGPPLDPFAAYPAQNFGVFGQGTQFGMNRHDQRGTNTQSPNTNWITQFHGLSMGS